MSTQSQQLANLSEEDHISLGQVIIQLLDHWGASASDQITILALPENTRTRVIRKYREGAPLPREERIRERIDHLLGIADALRTTYPRNSQMGGIWMNKPHRLFQQRTPLNTMIEDGLNGIITVRAHLDCAFDWHENGS